MELARPRKQRFELQFNGQKAIQCMTARTLEAAALPERLEVEPFTPEEVKIASLQADLDGPLVDTQPRARRSTWTAGKGGKSR